MNQLFFICLILFLNLSAVEIFIFQHILDLSVVFIEPVSITFLSFFKSVVCGIFEGHL